MGREESKEQAKAAQHEKEQAAFAKKQTMRDKQWEAGAKDSSKEQELVAKAEAAKARKQAAAAQEAAEGGALPAQPPPTKKCKECGHKMTPKEQKKGCPKCIEILFSGGAAGKKGAK